MNEQELQAALWEIVREVAQFDGYIYNDNNGLMECLFCHDFWGWSANDKHTKDHEPDCIIPKAKALAEKGILAQ